MADACGLGPFSAGALASQGAEVLRLELREGVEEERLAVNLGIGEFSTHFRTYFSGDWDVHWGYGILTHGHVWLWGWTYTWGFMNPILNQSAIYRGGSVCNGPIGGHVPNPFLRGFPIQIRMHVIFRDPWDPPNPTSQTGGSPFGPPLKTQAEAVLVTPETWS